MRTAQGTRDVHLADRGVAGTLEHLLQRADSAELHLVTARHLHVVRLCAPVRAAAGRFIRARQGGAQHDGVGTHREGLDDVTGVAQAAVGDHVHVAAAGFVHVVTAGGVDVRDGGRHRNADPQGAVRGGGGTTSETDEHTGRTGAHEVQRGRVGRRAADDDGDVEFVDELLEVEGAVAAGDVLRGHGRAADDEELHTGFDDGVPGARACEPGTARRRRSRRRRGSPRCAR